MISPHENDARLGEMSRTFIDGSKAGKEEAVKLALDALDQRGATVATARSVICAYINRLGLDVDWVHPRAKQAQQSKRGTDV